MSVAVAVGVMGSPSAIADPIPPASFIIDETTKKNPGKTAITVGSAFDLQTSCEGVRPNNPRILGRNALCHIDFFNIPFTQKNSVLVEFIEPGPDRKLISDTLEVSVTPESEDPAVGTRLNINFVSDSSKPAPGLSGNDIQHPDEVAGPVAIDISSLGLISSFGVPLTTITVINDADDQGTDPAPEPATYVLLATGCLALFITGWRRRRAGVDAPIAFM
jgi:hypothetical protein